MPSNTFEALYNHYHCLPPKHFPCPQRLEGDALLFNGHSISVQDKENVLEVDSDNDYTALRMCLMAWYCTCINSQNDK